MSVTVDNTISNNINKDQQDITSDSAISTSSKQKGIGKFFKPLENKPYYSSLFEKEEGERKKNEETSSQVDLMEDDKTSQESANTTQDEQESKENQAKQPTLIKRNVGREIIPGLYLGSRLAAQNHNWLKEHVRYILNVTSEIESYFKDAGEFEYKRISVDDSQDVLICKYFEEGANFISKALEERQEHLKNQKTDSSEATMQVTDGKLEKKGGFPTFEKLL